MSKHLLSIIYVINWGRSLDDSNFSDKDCNSGHLWGPETCQELCPQPLTLTLHQQRPLPHPGAPQRMTLRSPSAGVLDPERLGVGTDPNFPNPSRPFSCQAQHLELSGRRAFLPPNSPPLAAPREAGSSPSCQELTRTLCRAAQGPGESSSRAPALAAGPGLRALVWEHFNVF